MRVYSPTARRFIVGIVGSLLVGWTLVSGTAAQDEPKPAAKATSKSAKEAVVEKKQLPENPFPRRTLRAPPLDGGLGWLNTAGPVEISKLRGKVVLLDFWTYCCINCMHILPDLAKLEAEFPNELVVIGVHSAKFQGERDTENIRDAILRYNIKHPVVNDGRMEIWGNYGVRAWPTQILIDPEGYVIGGQSGEGNYELFREAIAKLIEYHKAKGTLDSRPIHFQLEQYGAENTPLRYPGKVAADPKTNRLYVADSSHNRIVIAKLDTGEVQHVVGDGVAEWKDGSFAEARFNDPQGLAFRDDVLYVADTKSHSIRKLDLKAGKVTTIAGTGKQGYERTRTDRGTDISLASPWALWLTGDDMYVAMAGTHQIWRMSIEKGIIGPYAGSGRENIVDDDLKNSQFAQPSGLTADDEWLYVADSEVSAIRKVSLTKDRVETVVGEGLFEFGDVDGVGGKARLQHALGVAYHNALLYVADTYNNKIKTLNPKTRESVSFLGDRESGKTDDPPRFGEPGGLWVAGEQLYVADTNNHAIRVIDLTTKKVRTVELSGLKPPVKAEAPVDLANQQTIEADPIVLKSADQVRIKGRIETPEGHKLNPQAPMSYQVFKVSDDGKAVRLAKGKITPIQPAFDLDVGKLDLADSKKLRVAVTYYPCEIGSEGVCRILTQVWNIPLTLDADKGADQITLAPKS